MLKLDLLKDDDWFDIEKKTLKSIFIECVDLWNNGLCIAQISEKVKLYRKTVANYLMSANRLNMCEYNTLEARSRGRKYRYEQCKQ